LRLSFYTYKNRWHLLEISEKTGDCCPRKQAEPLRKRNTTAEKNNTTNASSDEILEYRRQVNTDMAALRSDLKSRDQQIEELKAKLEALLKQQPNQNDAESAPGAEATAELVALLRKQIKHLEEQTSSEEGKISKLRDENRSLRTNLNAVMKKLGLKFQ